MTDTNGRKLTDHECVEQLRKTLASLDEAVGEWEAGKLQFQPSRQFGAEMLKGVLREVDRLNADARRYQHLRERFREAPWDGRYDYGFGSPQEVDEAIDASIKDSLSAQSPAVTQQHRQNPTRETQRNQVEP